MDFVRRVGIPATERDLLEGLRRYHRSFVRARPELTFLSLPLNSINLIAGSDVANSDIDLGITSVINLSTMRRVLADGQDEDSALFPDLPVDVGLDPSGNDFNLWLDFRLNRRTESIREDFMIRFIEALNISRRRRPHNPVWVTTWKRFESVREVIPERWSELVGVPAWTEVQWLVVLKYRLSEIGTLVRPTQLDAGLFSYHFPSPPAHPRQAGGIAMNLDGGATLPHVTPEFIHEQIEFNIKHWLRGGRLLKRASNPIAKPLNPLRKVHTEALQRIFGESGISEWLDLTREVEL